jgi:hypothetical protein
MKVVPARSTGSRRRTSVTISPGSSDVVKFEKKSSFAHRPAPTGTLHLEFSVEHHGQRGPFRRRIAVHTASADRSPVSDSDVAYQRHRLSNHGTTIEEKLVLLDFPMRRSQ